MSEFKAPENSLSRQVLWTLAGCLFRGGWGAKWGLVPVAAPIGATKKNLFLHVNLNEFIDGAGFLFTRALLPL
jgi:hypothetical protein